MMIGRIGIGTAVAALVAITACSSKQQPAPEAPSEPAVEEVEEVDPWAEADLIERPEAPAPGEVPLPEVVELTLENGLEVVVVEDRDIPVAEVHVAIRAGERDVPRDKTGLARFAAEMLTHGTHNRDALAIAEAIDFVGGALEARASREATLVSCEVRSVDLPTCLDLVPEVLTQPAFPEEEMAQVERSFRSELRARRDSAGQLASRHFDNAVWGDDHVRGWILSDRSLDAIAREDLVDWHARWFSPSNAVLSIAGDVDAEALAVELERSFGRWKRAEVPDRPSYREPELSGLRVRLVDKPDQSQAHVYVGHLGISRHDDDFFDTMVVNYILGGGGFSSRLMQVLRVEENMTYGASSSFDAQADRGAFVASTFTKTPRAVEIAELLVQEIRKLAAEGPTGAEVEGAVGNLAAQYAMRFETAGDVASALLSARIRGLAEEDVRNYPLSIGGVTVESARTAAARRLDPENLVAVIVGPAGEIAPQLDRAGWSYEVVRHNEPVAGYERRALRAEAEAPADPAAARAAVDILDEALAAKGGFERLSAIDTVALEGRAEVQMGPQTLPATLSRALVRPDKVRIDLDIRGGIAEVTTAFDGERGWMRQSAGGQAQLMDLPASERASVEAELWRDPEFVLLRHRDDGTIAEALAEQTIDGAPHHAVRLRSGDGHEVVLYIDKAGHRLRRMTYRGVDGGETTESFSDYREVDGIAVAHERETSAAQQSMKLKVQRVRFGQAISPSHFARPAD